MQIIKEELGRSDIVKGVYEGGFKVWEGTINLVKYMMDQGSLDDRVVMEIGCGQGQAGIHALSQNAS